MEGSLSPSQACCHDDQLLERGEGDSGRGIPQLTPSTSPTAQPRPWCPDPYPRGHHPGLYLREKCAVRKVLSVSGKKGRTGVGSGGPGVPTRCSCRYTLWKSQMKGFLSLSPPHNAGSAQGRALVPCGWPPFIPAVGHRTAAPGEAACQELPGRGSPSILVTGPATAPGGCSGTPSPLHSDTGASLCAQSVPHGLS